MKLQVNSYIKRDDYEGFISGQVDFQSIVTNKEALDLPDTLIVNLSKSGNPKCDTPIKFLQSHNDHAGTFSSHTIMREYINRVVRDAQSTIERYNLDLQEYQQALKEIAYPIIEDNDDLVPPPIGMGPPPGMLVLDQDKMQFLHDLLFGDVELELIDEEDMFLEEDEE